MWVLWQHAAVTGDCAGGEGRRQTALLPQVQERDIVLEREMTELDFPSQIMWVLIGRGEHSPVKHHSLRREEKKQQCVTREQSYF